MTSNATEAAVAASPTTRLPDPDAASPQPVALPVPLKPEGFGVLRSYWRHLEIFVGFAIWGLFWMPLLALLRAVAPKARIRAGAIAQKHCCWMLQRIARIAVEVHGEPPPGATMVVSNHLSYLDPIILGYEKPMHFVGQSGIASWPFIGWFATMMGSIFLARFELSALKKTNETMAAYFENGVPVLVFLEGTTTAGDRVLKFNGALLDSAIKTGTPITPVAVHYSAPGWKQDPSVALCWWGKMGFFEHTYNLLGIPRLVAKVGFGTPIKVEGETRKTLAPKLRRAVAETYAKFSGVSADELERLGDTPAYFPKD